MRTHIYFIPLIIIGLLLFQQAGQAGDKLTVYPKNLSSKCRLSKTSLYDQCHPQIQIFEEALSEAKDQGKTLLVVLGTDNCLPCQSFAKYSEGYFASMSSIQTTSKDSKREQSERLIKFLALEGPEPHQSRQESRKLAEFVAKNFVIVHVDIQKEAQLTELLNRTDSASFYDATSLPFIFSVTSEGDYAAHIDNVQVLISTGIFEPIQYGYNRKQLIEELKVLHMLAQ